MRLQKNIIIFRTDRLGDFIIHSRPILELKKKFPNSNIILVCSELNKKIIDNYDFIDRTIVYDKSFSFLKKIKIFFYIINKIYFLSLVLDGKKFSYFCNIFIKSKHKLGIVYKYYLNFFNFKIKCLKPSRFYNYFFFNKYEIFTSRRFLLKSENLSQKYIDLLSQFNLGITNKDAYIFPNDSKKILNQFNKLSIKFNIKKYILIHFDEKWLDVKDIEKDLIHNLIQFQKKSKLNLILTGYNNNFEYFRTLKNFFYYFDFKSFTFLNKKFNNKKIMIIDNLDIFIFEKFLSKSIINISCHSGFLAQVCGANQSNVIDIINRKDEVWYSCWKPTNTFHRFVYKSNNKKLSLKFIFNNIFKVLKKKL